MKPFPCPKVLSPALLLAVVAMLLPIDAHAASSERSKPLTFVIVHGAWGGGWAFREVERLLRADGHIVYRPTLTGQGEKVHLAHPDIDLNTHITDVVNVILWEELRDVVLVGHSYGGMVITGVADRVPERLKHIIYLDAIVPQDGESLVDAFGDSGRALTIVDGFIPPGAAAAAKPIPRDVPHPAKTVTQPISLRNQEAVKNIPTTYVLYVEKAQAAEQTRFHRFYERAQSRGWNLLTLESDHNAQWSHPQELAALLQKAVAP